MIAGASRALRKDPTLQFTFYGDERQVESQIAGHKNLAAHSQIVHSPEAIGASEKPSQAIRRARTTSMGMAINAVKEQCADAALSGGNTGALMAMSKLALRTMPGIDRPTARPRSPQLPHDWRDPPARDLVTPPSASGLNPAIITPAPNATPATDAVTPAQVSNGKKLVPMKPSPEPITNSTPITHIKSFNASGFHLATRDLPPIATASNRISR